MFIVLTVHNHMNRTKVDGFEGYGSFSLVLNYVLPFEEMKTIISMSKGCRQFVKWECHSAAMRNPYNDKSKGTSYITFWTNRYYAHWIFTDFKTFQKIHQANH